MSSPHRYSVIMTGLLKCFAIHLAILLLAVPLGPASAGNDGFRIQDYVPEYFRDTELRVSGSFDLRGTDAGNDYAASFEHGDISNSIESNSDNQRFGAGSFFLFLFHANSFRDL